MNIIECQNLSKAYRKEYAINDLTFTIKPNTITGLIGRNGAGKTTLLKIIAGFYQKSSGKIEVFSEDPFNSLKVSANMIFIDDQMAFPHTLCLSEILDAAKNFYRNWDIELAQKLFEYFQFNPKKSHHQLSKGMKSTFNMIIGISARCPLTILDEPTTGMDASVRKDFYRALLKDYIQFPRTIILSSHLLNELEDILEDILLIHHGQKQIHMSVADLKDFAIGLTGKTSAVEEMTKNLTIYYKEKIGDNSTYLVVENHFSEQTLQKAKMMGIERSTVTTDDLCIYLTSKSKGGIDDVFNRS